MVDGISRVKSFVADLPEDSVTESMIDQLLQHFGPLVLVPSSASSGEAAGQQLTARRALQLAAQINTEITQAGVSSLDKRHVLLLVRAFAYLISQANTEDDTSVQAAVQPFISTTCVAILRCSNLSSIHPSVCRLAASLSSDELPLEDVIVREAEKAANADGDDEDGDRSEGTVSAVALGELVTCYLTQLWETNRQQRLSAAVAALTPLLVSLAGSAPPPIPSHPTRLDIPAPLRLLLTLAPPVLDASPSAPDTALLLFSSVRHTQSSYAFAVACFGHLFSPRSLPLAHASDCRWAAIVRGLADTESITRKRAKMMLQRLLARGEEGGRKDGWADFFGLMDVLEEYAAHLVKTQWPPRFKALMRLCGSSMPDSTPLTSMQPLWVECLVLRALTHENGNVTKFVLTSLMDTMATAEDKGGFRFTDSFLFDRLLVALADPGLFASRVEAPAMERSVRLFVHETLKAHPDPHFAVPRYLSFVVANVVNATPLRLFLEVLADLPTDDGRTPRTLKEEHVKGPVSQLPSRQMREAAVAMRPTLYSILLRILANHTAPGSVTPATAVALFASLPDRLVDRPADRGLMKAAVKAMWPDGAALMDWYWSVYAGVLGKGEVEGVKELGSADRVVCRGLGRLMLVCDGDGTHDLTKQSLPALETSVLQVYSHSYLPAAAVRCRLYIFSYLLTHMPTFMAADAAALQRVAVEVMSYVAMKAEECLAACGSSQQQNTECGRVCVDLCECGYLLIWVVDALATRLHTQLPRAEELLATAHRLLSSACSPDAPASIDTAILASFASGLIAALTPTCSPSSPLLPSVFVSISAASPPRPAMSRAEGKDIRLLIQQGGEEHSGEGESSSVLQVLQGAEGVTTARESRESSTRIREGGGPWRTWRDVRDHFFVSQYLAIARLAAMGDRSNPPAANTSTPLLMTLLPSFPLPPTAPSSPLTATECFARSLMDRLDACEAGAASVLLRAVRWLALPILFSRVGDETDQGRRAALREALECLCGSVWRYLEDIQLSLGTNELLRELSLTVFNALTIDAEAHLYAEGEPAEARPVLTSLRRGLSLGDQCLGVTRAATVPFLSALARLWASPSCGDLPDAAMEPYVSALAELLVAREGVLQDGAQSRPLDVFAASSSSDTHARHPSDPPYVSCGDGAGDDVSPIRPPAWFPSSEAANIDIRAFVESSALARVLALCFIDGLGRAVREGSVSLSAQRFVRATVSALTRRLDQNLEDIRRPPDEKKGIKKSADKPTAAPSAAMPNSLYHRIQIRGWQSLACVVQYVLGDDEGRDTSTLEQLADFVFRHASCAHFPDVRHYIDLVGCAVGVRHPSGVAGRLVEGLTRTEFTVQCQTTFVTVAGYMLLHLPMAFSATHGSAGPSSDVARNTEVCWQILEALLPYLTSNFAPLRIPTQVTLHRLLQHLINTPSSDGASAFTATDGAANTPFVTKAGRALLCGVVRYLAESREASKVRQRTTLIWDLLDPFSECNIEVLLPEGGPMPREVDVPTDESLAGQPGGAPVWMDDDLRPSWSFISTMMVSIREEMTTEVLQYDEPFKASSAPPPLPAPLADSVPIDTPPVASTRPDPSSADDGALAWQRKFTPWAVSHIEGDCGQGRGGYGARVRSELIVVASLIDRVPNLAGLTRTAEVFNAKCLVVPKKSVLRDPSFKAIAVTADRWLPITEVEASSLPAYVQARRREGYQCVGVEQSATSVQLTSFVFPQRCVLLLGAEKEGVPADMLHLLDHCVEIPQMGVIRSLNVHVSGALCIWEYSKQHALGTQLYR